MEAWNCDDRRHTQRNINTEDAASARNATLHLTAGAQSPRTNNPPHSITLRETAIITNQCRHHQHQHQHASPTNLPKKGSPPAAGVIVRECDAETIDYAEGPLRK